MAEPQFVDGIGCERSAVTLGSAWSYSRRRQGPSHKKATSRGPLSVGEPAPSLSFAGNEKINKGEKHVKATIENGELVIRLPLNKTPALSTTGKSLVVATSHGNQKTDAVVNGQPVIVGVNAYIARPTR
jgi:hypothetical protein